MIVLREKERFAKEVENELKHRGYEAEGKVSDQNNGVEVPNVLIKYGAGGPVVYLKKAYESYLQGETITSIVTGIINELASQNFEERCETMQKKIQDTMDYEKIKDNLFLQVLNYEENKERLSGFMTKRVMDLVYVLKILVEKNEEACASLKVSKQMRGGWDGLSDDQLWKYAMERTKTLFPPTVQSIKNIMSGMMNVDLDDLVEDVPMYILSNTDTMNGAIYFTDKETLLRVGNKLKCRAFYIIPSSIHESILIKEEENIEVSELRNMLKDVNNQEVSPEEILSYHIYHYDTILNELSMAE